MSASPVINSPVFPPTVIQGFGNEPVQTSGIQQQKISAGKLKVFGYIQIGLGIALGILSLVGVILDFIAISKYQDCLNGRDIDGYKDLVYNTYHAVAYSRYCNEYSHLLLSLDITCLICSGWYILTGLLPLCMTRRRESSWKCLKMSFMVCSIIGASLVVPTMFGIAVVAAAFRNKHERGTVVTPALVAVLSFTQFVVAIVAASFCCCCSAWGTSDQQTVIYVDGTQPMMLNQQLTQPQMENIQPVFNGQPSYSIDQNPRAHQYQVMNTNEPTGQQIQTVGGQLLSMNSTQLDFDSNPPPYKQ